MKIINLNLVKRTLTMLLAVIMVITMIPTRPADVFAASEDVASDNTEGDSVVSGTKSSITTDAGDKIFIVGKSQEFTFTTCANDDAGKMVVGTANFDKPKAIESLEYYEIQNDTWYPLEGEFGPATGFPMSDATSTFRVTFKEIGDYTLNAYMKEVETDKILCETSVTIKVRNESDMHFGKTNLEIKFTDVNEFNDTLVDTVVGAEYTYTSSDENIVIVDENGILKPTGIGKATITAIRNENDQYTSASAEYTVDVKVGIQDELVWNYTVPDNIAWDNADGYCNTVSGGSGEGNVTYTSNNTDIAEVNSQTGILNLKKPGEVKITATKDGGGLYEVQTASYTLNVSKSLKNKLEFTYNNPEAIFVDNNFKNVVKGDYPNATINYTSSNNDIASVNQEGVVTAHGVPLDKESASVNITASISGNGYYDDISVSYTLNIIRRLQETELVFAKGTEGQTIKYGEEYDNVASGGDTTPIEYKSSDETIATVDENGNVTALKAGTVIITAIAPKTDKYEEQTLSYMLTIERAVQTVKFENGNTNIPVITYGDSYSNNATAKTGIEYMSSDPSIAEVDQNGVLTINKAGTVIITATACENDMYAKASSSYTITINKAKQNITFEKGEELNVTFNDNENKFLNNAFSNATTDENDINIEYSILNGSNLIVNGSFDAATGSFEIKGAGVIIVNAHFTANERYDENSASYTLVVKKDTQSIAFESEEYTMINGDNSFISPLAEEQGSLFGFTYIEYTIENDNDDIISAIDSATGELTFTNKTGEAVIRATKPADANYEAATATYKLKIVYDELKDGNAYYLDGYKKDKDSEWFAGNVSIKATEGYLLSYHADIEKAKWTDTLSDAVTSDGSHNITFYVKNITSGKIYSGQNINIKIDKTNPVAEIKNEHKMNWGESFLSFVGLGFLVSSNINFAITGTDDISGVKNIQYLVVEGSTEVMDKTALDNTDASDWITYDKEISINKDKIFVLYAKVTDMAGNYVYATTNGIILDKTPISDSDIKINIINDSVAGFYDGNVELSVEVEDSVNSSGINKISYEILNNGIKTQSDILFKYENDNPSYDQLIFSWSSIENNKNIVVDSSLNNSDDVRVIITVVDNGGNTSSKEISLKISNVKPVIGISYIDNPEIVCTHKGFSIYNEKRTVKIDIITRTSIFNASKAPEIIINQNRGDGENTATYEVSEWTTEENKNNPNESRHTCIIKFNGSASYNYSVNFTDIFGNELTYSSNNFIVDFDNPTASISVGEDTVWTKLLQILTFGLWKNDKVAVKAEAYDATTPIKKFEMYKTDSVNAFNSKELDSLYASGAFSEYEPFDVLEDEKFVLYIRVEDYAGHYKYFCSDGFVVDTTPSDISISPENTDFYHNNIPLYNDDIDVRIDVVEKKDGSYSGIKEIKYWVTCDGIITQEEILYSFAYNMEDYIAESKNVPGYDQLRYEFLDIVTIDSAKNNSCDVELFVRVTDNAGNVNTKSIKVDIDIIKPTVKVEYDNNSLYTTYGERCYYSDDRAATITIVERAGHFDFDKATDSIKIKAEDIDGNPVVVDGRRLNVDEDGYLINISDLFGDLSWNTLDNENPDYAAHSLVLPYHYDAIYTFDISYVDMANNKNEKVDTYGQTTPYQFTIDKLTPVVKISPEKGIYNSDVNIAVSVVDPKNMDSDACSGIKEIKYEIYNMGVKTQDDILYAINSGEGELLQSWEKENAIFVDKNLNNSNDVKIIVYVVDNTGNSIKVESNIIIDVTAPKIDVFYDNNDGDMSFDESIYFKTNRTAKIVVTERNFDPKLVDIDINNTDGYIPKVSRWYTVEADGNGDDTTHTAYVVFDKDGDYTFGISCYDIANNANEAVNYVDSIATDKFTIDKTAPILSVEYDNNDVLNGNYYKKQRKATITVTEHNFETSRIKMILNSTNDGIVTNITEIGSWVTKGDIHTLTINYDADSLYTFDFDYIDKAGNSTVNMEEHKFYIDKTKPVLEIENIVDKSSNDDEGNIGFVMTAIDDNLDVFTPILTAVIKNGNIFETKQLEIGEISDIDNGKMLTIKNIESDGIYRINCTLVDKAGNAYSEVVLERADGTKYIEKRADKDTLLTFSINRNGSTFELDENTIDIVDKSYIQIVENDIVIVEINVEPLKEYAVTLNGKELEIDKDYTVVKEGDSESWMKYTYIVDKQLFKDEGEYKLVVSSKDMADNSAFSDIKEAAVEFVIDRTAPVVTVSGITNDGRYQTEKQTVTLIPTDDGGVLKSLVVNMIDDNGKIIKEVVNLSGDALRSELEANGGKINFQISEGLYQNVQIVCSDSANDELGMSNTREVIIENVSVSSSMFMILWANKPLRWGVIGGISAVVILAVFVIIKKKKSKAE